MGNKLTKLANRLDAIEKHLGLQNEEDKPTERKFLDVGKWYISDIVENLLVYIVDKKSRFGISKFNTWFDTTECRGNLENDGYREATPQEVEQALIKEAKRRGLLEVGVRFKSPDGTDYGYLYNGGKVYYNSKPERLVFREDESTGTHLFFKGQWATIIEQDKFAELKEAHRNGKVIQCYNVCLEEWYPIENPKWDTKSEYRIKPEEKPIIKPRLGRKQERVILDDNNNGHEICVFHEKYKHLASLVVEFLKGKENLK